jgi:tRNA (guanine-N7-)-methyltransferase
MWRKIRLFGKLINGLIQSVSDIVHPGKPSNVYFRSRIEINKRMSRRNKLLKFAELAEMPNVYENFSVTEPQLYARGQKPVSMQAKWSTEHFCNESPLTLELACGRGEYTVGLAERFPQRSFIGVDVKGARIWKGARQSIERGLSNAAFLRSRIECIDAFFGEGEIDEIWITFPDPFPRYGQRNRRLTAPVFLEKYRSILKKGGLMHLKTDNTGIFLYTLETIASDDSCHLIEMSDNVHAHDLGMPELSIPTYYERLHRDQGSLIKYARFTIH